MEGVFFLYKNENVKHIFCVYGVTEAVFQWWSAFIFGQL